MRKKPLAALALACATLAACGGETYSGAEPESERADAPAKLVQECSPSIAKAPQVPFEQVPPGLGVIAELGDERRADLTVEGAEVVRSVPDRFGKSGSFRASGGASLIVVSVRFINRSDKPLEAADTIGKSFDIRAGDSVYKRADATEECSTISPSAASEADETKSPEIDVATDEGYSTVLVYSVPTAAIRATGLSWSSAVAQLQAPLRLKPN